MKTALSLVLLITSAPFVGFAESQAQLTFKIARIKSCGTGCFVLSQELKNAGNAAVAIRTVGLARVSSFLVAVSKDERGRLSGRSSTQLGDPIPGIEVPTACKVLKPGQAFKTQTEVHVPATFHKGDLISFDQEYADFQQHQCNGTAFFQGTSKSNQLRIVYR